MLITCNSYQSVRVHSILILKCSDLNIIIMSYTTNIRSNDAFSSTSSLATHPLSKPRQSKCRPYFHEIIQFLNSFNVDRKDTDDNSHQRAKSALRIFFIYMFFVSNVLIVAISSHSQHNYLITNAFEYHLINAQFPVKAAWLERDVRYNPYKNARDKYEDAFRINFNQITTFADVSC
jgi:hypothetical protein